MSHPIPSPCILICQIEPNSGLCYGCGRRMDEISAWGTMPAPERNAIMASLPDRMAQLPKRERRVTKRRQRQRTRVAQDGAFQEVGGV